MNRSLFRTFALTATLLCTATLAHAWHLEGRVYCDGTGLPYAGITINVVSATGTAAFSGSSTTDETGHYLVTLPDVSGCFTATIALTSQQTPVNPASGSYDFCTTANDYLIARDWVINGPECQKSAGRCWLTAGGAKFSAITGTQLGENGPQHSWGGNVNPGCSPTAGDGGNWNHVAHSLKLHFQGRAITVVRCGNVDGIPPGSTSPVTPFNFIEFTGTGTLKGIRGNKADYGTVYFFARCEDRNEPGSQGVRDGALKDRYFLQVYSNPADPAGSTLLLIDVDGDPATVDPLTITDGNMQLHISSCDFAATVAAQPTTGAAAVRAPAESDITVEQSTGVWLSRSPNPATESTVIRFGLPRDADVSMAVYDLTGRRMADLAGGRMEAGSHTTVWNLRDQSNQRVGKGIYFLRMRVDGRVTSKTISVLR